MKGILLLDVLLYVKELTQELTQERFRLFGSRWKWLIVY